MAVMRPVSRFPTPPDRPVLRAVQPLAKVSADEDWQPEVLRLSRVNDDREVQLVNRVHARIAGAIGRNYGERVARRDPRHPRRAVPDRA
jgi:hypothetical protein